MSNMKITRGQIMNKIAMDAFNDEFTKLAADAVVEENKSSVPPKGVGKSIGDIYVDENKSAVTPTKSLWSDIKGVGKGIKDIYWAKQLGDGLERRKAFGHSVRAIDEMVKQDPDQEKDIREAFKEYYDAYDGANKDIAVGALKTVGAYGIPVAGTIGTIILAKKMKERKRRQQEAMVGQ